MKPSTIYAADLYCGCGGASAGLHRAAEKLGAAVHLVAINHWDKAIATHSANYPGAVHYLTGVRAVDPRKAVPGGRLTLLLAGPSCPHFSRARGGAPVNNQQRSHAWDVYRWCRKLHVENVLVENVADFLTWGPLRQMRDKETGELLFDEKTGNPLMEPDPLRKGDYFRLWVRAHQKLGYTVEWRILKAAHFGDATTRERLFIQMRLSGRITWPKPTHYAPSDLPAFPGAKAWVPARDIIDWSIPGVSIFGRKKDLAPNTIKRILAGLRKFCGVSFTIGQQSDAAPRSTDEPIATVATAGAISLVEPFIVILKGTKERQLQQSIQGVTSPLPAICAQAGHIALCEPFLIPNFGEKEGQSPRVHGVHAPLPTVTGHGAGCLIEPFLVGVGGPSGKQAPKGIDAPFGVILAENHTGLCEPYLIRFNGPNGEDRSENIDAPVTTLDTSNRLGLAQPYLINYYGTGGAYDIGDPLDTVTTKDRFALIEPFIEKGDRLALLDIRFRMLQPHELAAAHSFPKSYAFAGGTADKVKQVGNSWPVCLSTALCEAILSSGGAA